MEFTAEQINKAFDDLPNTTSKAIHRIDVDQKIIEIINKNKLHLDIGSVLSNYVTFTLIGLLKTEDFGQNIIKGLGLQKEDCEKIITDVNETIFKPILEKMKNFQEEGEFFKDLDIQNIPDKDIPLPPYQEVKSNKPQIVKEEEIPVPNYNKTTNGEEMLILMPNYSGTTNEKEIYAESGIEVVNGGSINIKQQTVNKEEDYKALEDFGIDIIGEKLIGPTTSTATTSDYTIPKMGEK
jgi:hypothetical protein